ncbi:MAG: AEC family transporter, partial [Ruminococcus sp.]|nr:AEC family transporter [Ruminococcus sp.]
MSQIILQQAFIMLVLILIGAGCFRFRLLSQSTVSEISRLVLTVVNPIVILLAYQRELKAELAVNLGWTFLLSVLSYAAAMLISYLAIPDKEGRETAIERFSCIYSNCGFMGIPLVQAMFELEGVFYLTAFITIFNILAWTHGVMQISGQHSLHSLKKVLRSPAIIAIALGMFLFFTQLRLPELLTQPLAMVGELNTPLAMFVAGATIAQTNLPAVLKKPRVFYLCALRLLIIPAAALLLFLCTPFDSIIEMTVLAAAAAPSAAMCTMQCINYQKNAAYASEIFA